MDAAREREKNFVFGADRQNPWLARYRPRASMRTFQHAPWADPKPFGSEVPKQPAYLEEYRRVCNIPVPTAYRQPPPSLAMANYKQSDLNPSVAQDRESMKYRILLFADGIPKALGLFNTDTECVAGYWAVKDRQERGTLPEPQRHGVLGVPASAKNMGPPGVALRGTGDWQHNRGNRLRPRSSLLHSLSYGQGRKVPQYEGACPTHSGTPKDPVFAALGPGPHTGKSLSFDDRS